MLTKNDCFLLLSELNERGIDTKQITTKLIKSTSVDMDVLKFIHNHKSLEVKLFYEKLRKSYNQKKSKLYKSIVQIDEKEPKDIILTLNCLLTQILLFSNDVEDRTMFLKHSRADEISKVVCNYFATYDLALASRMIHLIKADLKAFESIVNND